MAFSKAVKKNANLRLALCGPAGSGKTMTLLKLATALGGPIAFVDTEHGSASKYAHTDTCGGPGVCLAPDHFDFDVVEPSSYDPRTLIDFIGEAVASGYRCICIDSLSHYWMGVGGELEQVDNAAAKIKGNSFAAWKSVTPLHNKLVDTMIAARIHVMISLRTKTEWVIEKNEKGQSTPRKVGLQPIMREGIEFEFDVVGDMDQENKLVVSKSRCSALSGLVIDRPGAEMAGALSEWLAGAPVEPPAAARTVPEELQQAFDAMDHDKNAMPGAFSAMEDVFTERMGAEAGPAAYRRLLNDFRRRFPKGKVYPMKVYQDCLIDMWESLAEIQQEVAEHA